MKKSKHDQVNKPTPEANAVQNLSARTELLTTLRDHVLARPGTQAEKAAALGLTQPRLNDLLQGRVEKFRLDALAAVAEKAGLIVNIRTSHGYQSSAGRRRRTVYVSGTRTIFSVNPKDLGDLDTIAGTELIRDLLLCEAFASGLRRQDVVVSLNVNAKDGGIDAKVDREPSNVSFLSKGGTHLQIKTGTDFKPWQESSLKKELFGTPRGIPSKDNLGEAVRNCLEQGSTYFLLSLGHDLLPNDHTRAVQTLEGLFQACGFEKPSIKVLGQGQIASELGRFPSLCIAFNGYSDDRLFTVESWKQIAYMQTALQLGDVQKEFVSEVRSALQGDEIQHIRVIGEPGIGKTRLVLEAVSAAELAPSVVYFQNSEDIQRSRLFNELLKPDANYAAVIIVDDCDDRDRPSIWAALKGRPNIKLITIDHGIVDSADSSMRTIECPLLPKEQIGAILESYIDKSHEISNWTEWCSGSPRVAHAVGENLKLNPQDILKPPAQVPIWDRFILGYQEMSSSEAEQHLLVLRHIALFQKFGFEPPVDSEARFISELVQEADPLITWAKFQSIVRHHCKRRILQGRHTLFIVPKALHVYLWLEYWQHYGRGKDLTDFIARIPPAMKDWFTRLFIYAHANSVAQALVRGILSPTKGPFANRDFLESQEGARFLNVLAEADPRATLELLEMTYGQWTLDELRSLTAGRQNIVWTLEKIAVWQDHFPRAARLLTKMALAENANNSNNATGTFLGLFHLGLGWAPTEAPPSARLPIIRELLSSNDSSRRQLGLELCKTWLNIHGGTRIVGPEYQGLKPTVEFWRPKTYGEVFDAWKEVWRLVQTEMSTWTGSDYRFAEKSLIEAASGLIQVPHIADEVLDTLFKLSEHPLAKRNLLIEFVIHQIRFRPNRETEDTKKLIARLSELDNKLTGSSLWERIERFVLHTNYNEDYKEVDGEMQEDQGPTKRVEQLAGELLADKAIFESYIERLISSKGHRLPQLGAICARLVPERAMDEQLLTHIFSCKATANAQFMGGYLFTVFDQDPARWELLVSRLLNDPDTINMGVECVWQSGISVTIIELLRKFYEEGKLTAQAFTGLIYQRSKTVMPKDLVNRVIRSLLNRADKGSHAVAIDILHGVYCDKKSSEPLPVELTYDVLTANEFMSSENNVMHGYHWGVVAKKFVAEQPSQALNLLKFIVTRMERLSGIRNVSEPSQVADEIVKEHPHEAWQIISAALENKDAHRFNITHWLGDGGFEDQPDLGAIRFLDVNDLIYWVDEKREDRLWLILHMLPKTLDDTPGGRLTRTFLERYGSDERLGQSLISHFWTGGWWGPESKYLQRKRDTARRWLGEISSPTIQLWLSKYIDYLGERISAAEISEEREF